MNKKKYQEKVRKEYDELANDFHKTKTKNKTYYREFKSIFLDAVKPKSIILEIGCATGIILADTNPRKGVGIDISRSMIRIAKSNYPKYEFHCSSFEDFNLKNVKYKIDFILLPDVIEYFSDLNQAFSKINKLCSEKTIVIIASPNKIWDFPLLIAEKLKLKMKDRCNRRSSKRKITRILDSNGFIVKKYYTKLLIPKDFSNPFIKSINRNFHKIPIIKKLGLIRVFIARKKR